MKEHSTRTPMVTNQHEGYLGLLSSTSDLVLLVTDVITLQKVQEALDCGLNCILLAHTSMAQDGRLATGRVPTILNLQGTGAKFLSHSLDYDHPEL